MTTRTVPVSSMLADYSEWPFLLQVFKLERQVQQVQAHWQIETRQQVRSTGTGRYFSSPWRADFAAAMANAAT